MNTSGLVVVRDAVRTSRRWQTYVARVVFVALLFAALGLALRALAFASSSNVDVSDLQTAARAAFVVIAIVQSLLAMFLAPLVAARAVIEERVESTLDLVVLTGMKPARLYLALLSTRVAVLLLVVLGASPAMALLTTVGGVGVGEVVRATQAALVCLMVGAPLGGLFGLFTRHPGIAAGLALAVLGVLYLVVPPVIMLLAADAAVGGMISPWFTELAGPWSAVQLAVWAPTAVGLVALGAHQFGLLAGGSTTRAQFRSDAWAGRTMLVALVVVYMTGGVVAPLGAVLAWGGLQATVGPDGAVLGRGLLVGWCALALVVSVWLAARVGADLTDVFERLFERRANPRRRRRFVIRGNPVIWRELRPSSWGTGLVPVVVIGTLGAGGFAWIGGVFLPGGLSAIGWLAGLAGVAIAAYTASDHLAGERATQGWALLRLSTLPTRSLVFGKLMGALVPSLPLVLVGGVLLALGSPYYDLVVQAFSGEEPDGFGVAWILLRGLVNAVWVAAVWVAAALLGLLGGLRVANPRQAPNTVLGALGAVLIGGGLLAVLLHDWPVLAAPFRWVAGPLFVHMMPLESAVAIGLWSAVALGAWFGVHRSVQEVA